MRRRPALRKEQDEVIGTVITRFLDSLERTFQVLTAVFIGLLTLFVFWEAFARYVLHSGQYWSQDASLIAMVWLSLSGAAAAVWSDKHIRLTLVVNRLPVTGRRIMEAFADLMVAGFSFMLFLTGITLVKGTMGGTVSSIPIPIGYTNTIVPITAAVMFLFATTRFVRRVVAIFQAEVTPKE